MSHYDATSGRSCCTRRLARRETALRCLMEVSSTSVLSHLASSSLVKCSGSYPPSNVQNNNATLFVGWQPEYQPLLGLLNPVNAQANRLEV